MQRALLVSAVCVFLIACANGGSVRTDFVSSAAPDQIVLNLPEDPAAGMHISWRSDTTVDAAFIEYAPETSNAYATVQAYREVIDSRDYIRVRNDPVIHRFSAKLTDLTADTTYTYRVCSKLSDESACSPWQRFRTAPRSEEGSFTFAFLGDAQTGLDRWSANYNQMIRRWPDVRFTIIAGDLVNDGEDRSQIDQLFSGAFDAFSSVGFVPAPGNHDAEGAGEQLFTQTYVLPENGPAVEQDYWMKFGSTLVIVMDSNNDGQYVAKAAWMEQVIENHPSRWIIVSFHHPVWSAAADRDNKYLRSTFAPLFEKHGVALVLNGHDHAYMRTYPLIDGTVAEAGPVYIDAVSGSKVYQELRTSHTIATAFAGLATYQIIEVTSRQIHCRAYTWDDTLKDDFTITTRHD